MEKTNLTVTQLNNYVKGVFDDELILKDITVFGEVFECNRSGSALFVTLKDTESILHCVGFGDVLVPRIGDTVLVRGSVDYYVKGNRVSFRIKAIDYFGEGRLKRELLELTERLRNEGLFSNPLALPRFVRKIAVITSETGAVIHDIASVITKHHPYIDIFVYPVRVQGDGAENTIVDALKKANKRNSEDIIIIARGGGSGTDLACFNTEAVARAVFSSKIPVISSVGHEVDTTLCDFTASLRAGTPSIAAENVCRINELVIAEYYSLLQRLSNAARRVFQKSSVALCRDAKAMSDNAQAVLYKAGNRIVRDLNRSQFAIKAKYDASIKKLSTGFVRISASVDDLVSAKDKHLRERVASLNGANPLKIVASGYAKVYKDGVPVTSARSVEKGDGVDIALSDGIVRTAVVDVVGVNKE